MSDLAKLTVAATAILLLVAMWVSTSGADDAGEAATVWGLEQAIYDHRAAGDTKFYSDISSQRYLGWPAPAEKPVPYETIRGFATGGEFQPGEVIDVVSDGITIDGDTAISFYTTHRTVRPGGEPVDERYENIHVYVKRGTDWRLLGAMSRRVLPAELRTAPMSAAESD